MEHNMTLELRNVAKAFDATRALSDVNMVIKPGEVHAVLGQNGAGKSTLVKILAGVYKDFDGEVFVNGQKLAKKELQNVIKNKIGVVHQEFPLVPQLSVAENIFLGQFPKNKTTKRIDRKALFQNTRQFLSSLNLFLHPWIKVEDLSMGERQLLSIARALLIDPDVLVFDEATSTLSEREVDTIFHILQSLVKKGTSVIFISHKIEEIFKIADRITVLRDGVSVSTVKVAETDRNSLIQMMAGKEVQNQFPKREHTLGEVILSVKDFNDRANFKNCSFTLRKGEILGIAGLVGSGRPELVKAIFGANRRTGGELQFQNKKIRVNKPKDSIREGIYYVTSDRRKEGLLMQSSIRDNATLAFLNKFTSAGWINHQRERDITKEYIKKLSIKTTGPGQTISQLSGGNQQKVILSRWLCGDGKVFMFDEPTRGLDVGVKYDVYELMNKLVDDGGAIIMISSELPELLAMSDRVLVMHEGCIAAELNNDNLEQDTVLSYMMS